MNIECLRALKYQQITILAYVTRELSDQDHCEMETLSDGGFCHILLTGDLGSRACGHHRSRDTPAGTPGVAGGGERKGDTDGNEPVGGLSACFRKNPWHRKEVRRWGQVTGLGGQAGATLR